MKIDKIFVISLNATNEETQKNIADRLNACQFDGQTGYEIIQGFDGTTGNKPDGYEAYSKWNMGDDTWNEWWKRPVLPGEIGCAVSHRIIWEKIVMEGHSNVLILEDDFLCNHSVGELKIPENTPWEIALLGRYIIEDDVEEVQIGPQWVRPRHWYNAHAYVIKEPIVASKLLSGGLKESVIPVDEYLSALGYPHRREDIRNMFPPLMQIIATADPKHISQNRPGTPEHSSIEGIRNPGSRHDEVPSINIVDTPKVETPTPEPSEPKIEEPYFEILDDSDWDAWKEKYVNMSLAKGEYDLMVSDRGDNVYEFPLFTPKFCAEAIALAEAKDEWTIDRHEYYPTNDVLLQEIGLDDIYNRVLDEVVRPLAIHLWNLEGEAWDKFSNENFMARYTTNRQSHLSLHHDRSHLTMVIKLNDEFSGGGTWFPKYQKLSNPKEIGTAVLHPGMITHRHGARPITLGSRYITVSFIRSHKEP
jgi:hypothetical protein